MPWAIPRIFRALVPVSVSGLLAVTGCSGGSGDDDHGSAGATAQGGGSGMPSSAGTGGSSGTTGSAGTDGSSGAAGNAGTGGSSGTAGSAPDLGAIKPAKESEWTVFVYGHGDHNLSNSLLADLAEMSRADLGSDGTVNLIVLTDWNASQVIASSDPPEHFPTGVELFRVPGSGKDLELVAEGAELDLDDPEVLTSVVGTAFKAFPAKRHGVILWDHGGAWSGGFGSDTQDGTIDNPTAMPAEAIPPAILAGLETAGVKGTPPLDFMAFDTCLMAGAEIAYPFRGLAEVYLADAEIDYGNGWDYTTTFSDLAKNPSESAAAFAKAEVARWDAHHASATANDALLRSHAALDLGKVSDFASAAAELTSALGRSQSFDPIELGRSGFLALPPYASQFEDAGSSLPGLHDAGQVLDALAGSKSDDAVAAAAKKARSALDAVVLASSQGSLRASTGQLGMHVELGAASTLSADELAEYQARASEWNHASNWQSLLTTLVNAADDAPPMITHSVEPARGATKETPPVLTFASPEPDAASASVYLGAEVQGGKIALYGLVANGVIEPKDEIKYAWDGTVPMFDDHQPAMLDVWLDTGPTGEPVLMIPGLLDGAADTSLMTYLVFTADEVSPSVAVVSLGDVASTLTLAEIAQAAPSATFSPVYYVVDPSTGNTDLVPGDPMPLPASGTYELSPSYPGAGKYYFFTAVTDVWGNTGANADEFELDAPLGP